MPAFRVRRPRSPVVFPLAAIAISLLPITACSGGQNTGAASAPRDVLMPDVRVQGTGNLRYTLDETGTSHELEGESLAAWTHLLAAYRGVGLEPDIVDQAGMALGVSEVTITRRLGDERLSRLFSCGQTMTGPLADNARVTIHVESRVEPGGPSTAILVTRLDATAVPNDAAGGAARQCTSRHVVESRIAEAVQAALLRD